MIWETEMLERKQRISLKPDFQPWVLQATQCEMITLLPLDLSVVIAQRELPDSFHTDPADRLITDTSILADYLLATHDGRI